MGKKKKGNNCPLERKNGQSMGTLKKKKKFKSTFKDLILRSDFLPVNLDFEIKGQHERGKKKKKKGNMKEG